MSRSRKKVRERRGDNSLRWGLSTGLAALAILVTAAFIATRVSQPDGLPSENSGEGSYVILGDLAVSEESVDLGRIPLDTDVTHVFRLRNVSEETVRLGKVTVKALEGC